MAEAKVEWQGVRPSRVSLLRVGTGGKCRLPFSPTFLTEANKGKKIIECPRVSVGTRKKRRVCRGDEDDRETLYHTHALKDKEPSAPKNGDAD
jgi:hypothetical protein